MKNTLKTLLAVAAIGSASVANAVMYNAASDGLTSPSGITFSSTGGNLVIGTGNQGVKYLGVDGKQINEIEIGESVTIGLAGASYFSQITIGLLFDGPEFGDREEIAVFTADGVEYVFQATYTNAAGVTATYSNGAASFVNISPATSVTAAVWQISNPFLNAVSEVVFTSRNHAGTLHNFSDYGIISFEVPDAGSTIAFLGAGLFALAFVGRRIKR